MSILITALAPLSWSLYSVISKPVTRTVKPLLWTYLAVVLGTTASLPVLALPGVGAQIRDLDVASILAALFPTVFAFTVNGQELLGGALALLGLLIAVFRR